ncbi:trifunctional dihydropteroate synthetase [Xylographa bjoerkii]|nr:trifunctional dihydropteroate synthetase [Xylographa bjoerkii]
MNLSRELPVAQDIIFLRNLRLSAVVGIDAWGRAGKAQPIILSISLQKNLANAAAQDDINQTVSYGRMCKDVMKHVEDTISFGDLLTFNTMLANVASLNDWGGGNMDILTILPTASLKAEGGLGLITGFLGDEVRTLVDSSIKFLVKDMKLYCIIGVNPHERHSKQLVVVNLTIQEARSRDHVRDTRRIDGHISNWQFLLQDVIEVVESSRYETLEALASEIAKTALTRYTVRSIDVSVEKPSALAFVEGAGVQISRTFRMDSDLM